jgi:hypothetical protein
VIGFTAAASEQSDTRQPQNLEMQSPQVMTSTENRNLGEQNLVLQILLLEKDKHQSRKRNEQLLSEVEILQCQYENGMREYQETMKNLRNSLEIAYRELDLSVATQQRLSEQLLLAQKGNIRSMRKGGWIPKEDNRIREEFMNIEEKIKSWVEKYTVADLSSIESLPLAEKDSIILFLEGCCMQQSWDILMTNLTEKIQKKLPMVFVQALLARSIFGFFFNSPFCFLYGQERHCAHNLEQVYKMFQRGNSGEHHEQ